jgi:hypothetical protein
VWHAKSINCRQTHVALLKFRICIVQACGQKVMKRHWSDMGVYSTRRVAEKEVCKKKKKKLRCSAPCSVQVCVRRAEFHT